MSPMDIGIQRMNDRLALAAHEPATWIWLALSVAAIAVYAVAFLTMANSGDGILEWLGMAAGGCVAWILSGWMFELVTFDARGHISNLLGWQYTVMFAFPVAVAIGLPWLQSRPKPKVTDANNRYSYYRSEPW